jgi:hypothetical protein
MRSLGYFPTILVFMALGALVGLVVGAVYGYAMREVGWWGVGLLLGMIYGTIGGFAVADRP